MKCMKPEKLFSIPFGTDLPYRTLTILVYRRIKKKTLKYIGL